MSKRANRLEMATIHNCVEAIVKESNSKESATICEIVAGKMVPVKKRDAGSGYSCIEYLPGLYGFVTTNHLKFARKETKRDEQ